MRCLITLLCALAIVTLSPFRVAAQDGLPDASADPLNAPESEVQVSYVPAYRLEAADEEVRKARRRVGLWSLGVVAGAGIATGGAALAVICTFDQCNPGGGIALFSIGIVVGTVSLAAMIASGVKLHKRKDERDRLRATRPNPRRRLRWDYAAARWVF